jgi:hypothetical protein
MCFARIKYPSLDATDLASGEYTGGLVAALCCARDVYEQKYKVVLIRFGLHVTSRIVQQKHLHGR